MPDPLSTSAGVVGIAVPALHFTRLLIDDVKSLLDAPIAIQRLRDDLISLETAYESLQSIPEADWTTLGGNIATQAQAAVAFCEGICKSQHEDLQRWTKHSEGGTFSKRDRITVGFFKKQQLRALSDQLQGTKLTFTFVVNLANLYVICVVGKVCTSTDVHIGIVSSEAAKPLKRQAGRSLPRLRKSKDPHAQLTIH